MYKEDSSYRTSVSPFKDIPSNLVLSVLVKFFSVNPPSPTEYVVFVSIAANTPLVISKLAPTLIPPSFVSVAAVSVASVESPFSPLTP